MQEFYNFHACLLRDSFCRQFVNEAAIVRSVKLIAESLAVRPVLPQEDIKCCIELIDWGPIMLSL